MVGKAQLILIVGFSLIFSVLSFFWSDLTTKSVDNYLDYLKSTKAHNLAVSGANMALAKIYIEPTWVDGFSDLNYDNGEIDVTVTQLDSLRKDIVSVGTFLGVSKTVYVKLRVGSWAKFAWYIGNASSKKFVTGDTIWGRFHSQSFLNIEGNPVFYGKASVQKGLKPSASQLAELGYFPKFYGGLQTGIDIPIPNNYEFTDEKADAAGTDALFENTDLWIKFHGDGTLTYRTGIGPDTSGYSAPITTSFSTFAPKGVIYLAKGDIYLSGTFKGKGVIVSGEASGLGNGNVYLVDDIKYTQPPVIPIVNENGVTTYEPNEACTDMLGILATNNVRVSTSVESGGYLNNVVNKDLYVHASIFCAQGGFQLEDYNAITDPMGTLYLYGGVIAAKEELIAKLDALGNIIAGFKRHVVYDERFGIELPPHFPKMDAYEIFSWLE